MSSAHYEKILKIITPLFLLIYPLVSIIDVFKTGYAIFVLGISLLVLVNEVYATKSTVYYSKSMKLFFVYCYLTIIYLLTQPWLVSSTYSSLADLQNLQSENRVVITIFLIFAIFFGISSINVLYFARLITIIAFTPLIHYLYTKYIQAQIHEIKTQGYLAKDKKAIEQQADSYKIFGMEELEVKKDN